MPKLNKLEDVVKALHGAFQRQAAIKMAGSGNFDQKKAEIVTLCNDLAYRIRKIEKSPKDDISVEFTKCMNDYYTCDGSPEDCEDQLWNCLGTNE